MAERLYVKLWRSWYTGESHVDAGADALAIGPVLMTFVRWTPGIDVGYAENEMGRPVTTGAIAKRARWTTARAAAALRELVDLGTCIIRPDGAWGFPRFGPAQESASAAKMRKARQNSAVTSTVTVTTDVTPLAEDGVEDESLRGYPLTPKGGSGHNTVFALHAPSVAPGPTPATEPPKNGRKGKPRKPRAAVPDGLAEHVLAELQAACRELSGHPTAGPQRVTPGMLDSLAKLHAAEQPTADEWTRVIRRRLELSRQGDTYGSLDWEHLCRAASFRRYRDHVQGGRGARQTGRAEPTSRPTQSGVVDLRARFGVAAVKAEET